MCAKGYELFPFPSNNNSYGAIPLLSVLSKLFEKVLLSRIENCGVTSSLNPLHIGFQRRKSSKMTSFIYQEATNYCLERDNTVYTCFFDASKAFDMTWIDGLIYKLYHLGFTGKLLRIFNAMLSDSSSRVVMNGHLSEPFHIAQGTRQGSIWSPFLYTIYINELLNNLCQSPCQSPFGLKINNIQLCAQADDIVVISYQRWT